jgi:hypothetical protein
VKRSAHPISDNAAKQHLRTMAQGFHIEASPPSVGSRARQDSIRFRQFLGRDPRSDVADFA